MKLQQLASFVAIYEEGSFSRAAARVHATQSGLSMQIRKLETELDVTLLERTPRGVIPTSAGKRFYARAIDILRGIKIAEAEARQSSGQISGKIRVGVLPAFTQSIIAPTLVKFSERYPNVEVTILEGFSPLLSDAVVRGEVDFAIVPIDAPRNGIRYRHFATDREILVSSIDSDLEHLQSVAPGDLPGLKLVLPTRGNARRDLLELIFAGYDVSISSVLEMDSVAAALDLVANSEWKTILPAVICARDLQSTRRKLHPIERPRITVDYMFAEPQSIMTTDRTSLFLDVLKQEHQRTVDQWTNAVPDF